MINWKGKEIFSKDGWLKDWYFDNFSKKILDEDTNFAEMDEYLESFRSFSEELRSVANRDALGGGRLLVFQAICKSILKLCQNNLDVSEYAPTMSSGTREGISIFEVMGRSGVLGPSKTHQYPSRASQPVPTEDEAGPEYKIESFTKSGFLCFAALDTYLSYIRNIGTGNTCLLYTSDAADE